MDPKEAILSDAIRIAIDTTKKNIWLKRALIISSLINIALLLYEVVL